ncbi:hypothetical protein ABLI39_02295 [Pseudarthrobacter sp. B907]|uniref:hypothetical protein n=1 Tax=Pseudarthrobacter sp. B907 TaxID=3158261 RepID=UPI0032DBEAB8
MLAGFLCVGTSCSGGGETGSAVTALKSAAEEAMGLLAGEGKPAEYSALSGRLKQMAAEVPNPGSLKADDKVIFDTAAQRAQALQEVVDLFGATAEIKALFTSDSVALVRGSFLRQRSPELEAKLDTVAEKILKDTECGQFSDEMNRLTATPRCGTGAAPRQCLQCSHQRHHSSQPQPERGPAVREPQRTVEPDPV